MIKGHATTIKMKTLKIVPPFSEIKNASLIWRIFVGVLFTFGAYLITNAFLCGDNYTQALSRAGLGQSSLTTRPDKCKKQCRPVGSEALPEGIVKETSDLQMRPLWDYNKNKQWKTTPGLLAVAVGIKQKNIVNKTIEKFLNNDFVVMLFHYDGIVDEWREFGWNDRVIHVSARNQTKWWFAKRFLHPDVVAEYEYIFLWDEDLGVDFFHPKRYLSIIKDEGLEISQPALENSKSEVHYPITVRRRNSTVHRRIYKLRGNGRCYNNSTAPPCIGWVEMMAPVFSRAAWRCSWYMIQNDLIHAWGLDKQLGYCAQGDRTRNVGVVDSEYIVHLDVHTLGVTVGNITSDKSLDHPSQTNASLKSNVADARAEVRMQSYKEMNIFKKRWINAVKEDKCWVDPFQQPVNETSH